MINRRKMIDALLLLESALWWLASTAMNFIWIIGQGLKQFVGGRPGQRLLSHKEIYAGNLFKYWANYGRGGASGGLYIGRVGRYNSARGVRVGQD
jgi:hypothetical protein